MKSKFERRVRHQVTDHIFGFISREVYSWMYKWYLIKLPVSTHKLSSVKNHITKIGVI